jgi:hypothetical protein
MDLSRTLMLSIMAALVFFIILDASLLVKSGDSSREAPCPAPHGTRQDKSSSGSTHRSSHSADCARTRATSVEILDWRTQLRDEHKRHRLRDTECGPATWSSTSVRRSLPSKFQWYTPVPCQRLVGAADFEASYHVASRGRSTHTPVLTGSCPLSVFQGYLHLFIYPSRSS